MYQAYPDIRKTPDYSRHGPPVISEGTRDIFLGELNLQEKIPGNRRIATATTGSPMQNVLAITQEVFTHIEDNAPALFKELTGWIVKSNSKNTVTANFVSFGMGLVIKGYHISSLQPDAGRKNFLDEFVTLNPKAVRKKLEENVKKRPEEVLIVVRNSRIERDLASQPNLQFCIESVLPHAQDSNALVNGASTMTRLIGAFSPQLFYK